MAKEKITTFAIMEREAILDARIIAVQRVLRLYTAALGFTQGAASAARCAGLLDNSSAKVVAESAALIAVDAEGRADSAARAVFAPLFSL